MSSEYEGDEGPTFNINRLSAADFKDRCFVVGVSGIPINPCGHVLLEVGGFYFHVSRLGSRNPQWMDFAGLKRYFRENDKALLYREPVDDVVTPAKSLAHLGTLLRKRWTFGGVYNNCVTFAEDVVRAGYSQWDLEPHTPVVGPVWHAAGYVDLAASSTHPPTARDQKGFWALEKVRRLHHPKFQDYIRAGRKATFRFEWVGGDTPAYQELLDAK